jgi:hypothetical protein
MKLKDLLSNKGFTLASAVIALVIIAGSTSLIMQVTKNMTKENASSRATTIYEVERNKIASTLASVAVCRANFGGLTLAQLADIPSLKGSTAANLLTVKNTSYFNNLIKVSLIKVRATTLGELYYNVAEPDRNFVLEITYGDPTAKNSSYVGKKTSIITIPLYMKFTGTVVSDCYTYAQNNHIAEALAATCSPTLLAAASTSNRALLNAGVSCDVSASFETATATTCTQSAPLVSPSTFTALAGFNTTGNMLNFPNIADPLNPAGSTCRGIPTACATPGTSAFNITDNVVNCDFPGNTRDISCNIGDVLYHDTGALASCVSPTCPIANQFIQSINNTNTVCYEAPPVICPAGQYVSEFNPALPGGRTCSILPSWSGSCTPNFGVSVTRTGLNAATSNGILNCGTYDKTKTCPNPNSSTFVQSLDSTNVAVCNITTTSPVAAICGSANNTCALGTFLSDDPDTLGPVVWTYNWTCAGLYGGANTACALPMPAGCPPTLVQEPVTGLSCTLPAIANGFPSSCSVAISVAKACSAGSICGTAGYGYGTNIYNDDTCPAPTAPYNSASGCIGVTCGGAAASCTWSGNYTVTKTCNGGAF